MRLSAWTLEPEMGSDETQFLRSVIIEKQLSGIYVEIGTAAGGTLCQMMNCFTDQDRPKFVVIDPMNYFPSQLEAVQRNLRANSLDPMQVEFRIMPSSRAFALSKQNQEHLDLILIDGDHSISSVMSDLRWTKYLNARGLLCVHDYDERHTSVKMAVDRFLKRNTAFTVLGCQGALLIAQKVGVADSSSEVRLVDLCYAKLLGGALYIWQSGVRQLRRFTRKVVSSLNIASGGYSADRYVNREIQKLRSGLPHSTLGAHPANDGLLEFNALREAGLQPHHCVVDFGCGTLRLGRHIIPFLMPGNYWGLDITDRFLKFGICAFEPDVMRRLKSCHLHTISKSTLKRVAAATPDVVIVAGVIQCLSPKAMRRVMKQLGSICGPSTQILVTLLESEYTQRRGEFAFRYSAQDLGRAANEASLEMRVLRRGVEPSLLRGGIHRTEITQLSYRRGTLLLLRSAHTDVSGVLSTQALSTILR